MLLQRLFVICYTRRDISTSVVNNGNKYLNRQGKFMNKMIYGEIPKKKWFPVRDGKSQVITQSVTKIDTTKTHVTHRVKVLNKLFMKYITDLMATGEISSNVLGRGIEVSRVNVTNDFKLVKVFWFSSKSTPDELKDISNILRECAYKLRHELSQLRVIGVVPPIQFFQDKKLSCLAELEAKLLTADYGDDYTPTIVHPREPQLTLFTKIPEDVREKILESESNEELAEAEKEDEEEDTELYNIDLPPMRHDVLDLDHSKIMLKVHQALRKREETIKNRMDNLSTKEIQQPFNPLVIDEWRTEEETEAFDAFLLNRKIEAKRRQRMEEELMQEKLKIDPEVENDDINHIFEGTDIDFDDEVDEIDKTDRWTS